jgi:hypothetical protein
VVVQSIDDPGFFGIGIILVLLLDRLHEFVQLANLLICIQSAHVKRDYLHCTHHSFFRSCPCPSSRLSRSHLGVFERTIATLRGNQSTEQFLVKFDRL